MTTIIAWVSIKNNFAILAADSQITSGNLRLPISYQKIFPCGRSLVAGTGSVGNVQQLLKRAEQTLIIQKTLANTNSYMEHLKIGLDELASEISDLNWQLPLDHKYFSPFGFVLCGLDDENLPAIYSVGDDGSRIKFDRYWSDGSGSQLALSLLGESYDDDFNLSDACNILKKILLSVNKSDIFTDNKVSLWSVTGNGTVLEMEEKKPEVEVNNWVKV